jgi:hypothetical protein
MFSCPCRRRSLQPVRLRLPEFITLVHGRLRPTQISRRKNSLQTIEHGRGLLMFFSDRPPSLLYGSLPVYKTRAKTTELLQLASNRIVDCCAWIAIPV